MRIALVIETFNPTSGGAERSTATIASHLLARGHDVTVLTGYCPDDLDLPGLTVKVSPLGRPRGVLPLAVFVSWTRRQLPSYDVSLSVTTSVPASVVQPRAGLVKQSQARSIARRDTAIARLAKRVVIASSPRQWALRLAERRTMRDPAVRCFAAISRSVAHDLRDHYAIADDRIALVTNASQLPKVDPSQRAAWRNEVRVAFNISDDAVMFLFPAIDPWRKGLRPLMQAAAELKQRGVRFVLALAGSTSYAQQCLAERFEVREQVRMIGRTEQMAPLYCAADVTVMPTFYDTFGRVISESLSLGCPVITSRYAGAADHVQPEDRPMRGRVIDDPADFSALAQAMSELADPAERERCRSRIEPLDDLWTVERHVAALEQVLTRASTAPPSHAR